MITIGAARSLDTPADWTITPDDRQETVEILDGVTVEDFGVVDAGLKISFSCNFRTADFRILRGYWKTREKVDVTDGAGVLWAKCRVVLKSWRYVERFERQAVAATIEIWRV